MEQIQLEIQKREKIGSSGVKVIRDKGFIPGVIYGGDKKPLAIQIARKDFDRVMRQHEGESVLFSVQVTEGGKKIEEITALLKDLQHHPVKDIVDHLDFLRVSMDKEITVRAPIVIKGEAIGLKKPGATLEIGMREIEVICLPKDIPNHIAIDVTSLDTHHAIHVSDLALPAGVKTKVDPGAVVVAVVFTAQEEAAPAAAEGEAAAKAEPEVIKEKPKDDKAPAAGAAAAKPEAGAKK